MAEQLTPTALVAWLRAEMAADAEEASEDRRQLRLESDQNRVRLYQFAAVITPSARRPEEPEVKPGEIQASGIPDEGVPVERIVGSVERWLIAKAAEKAGWNQSQAARYLQLNRDKLRTRMKNHRIARPAGG